MKTLSSNSFIALRSEAMNDTEKDGLDRFFKMMIALRQQIILRKNYENECCNKS